MTDAERARALSGATRECPTCHGADYTTEVDGKLAGAAYDPSCGYTGRVPLLDPKRARKACPRCRNSEGFVQKCVSNGEFFYMHSLKFCLYHNAPLQIVSCPDCHGDGWLSTLLEEPETCPCSEHLLGDSPCPHCPPGCDGSGVIQAWRLQLLIDVLEEAGYILDYNTENDNGRWRILASGMSEPVGADDSLAVAACEALDIKV